MQIVANETTLGRTPMKRIWFGLLKLGEPIVIDPKELTHIFLNFGRKS